MAIEAGDASKEVGRRLKVSELQPHTVVVLQIPLRPMVTAWVKEITDNRVHFVMGEISVELIAKRTGEWLIFDEVPLTVREYLGKI